MLRAWNERSMKLIYDPKILRYYNQEKVGKRSKQQNGNTRNPNKRQNFIGISN